MDAVPERFKLADQALGGSLRTAALEVVAAEVAVELFSFGVSYVLTQVPPMWWNRTPSAAS